jgi:methyl-accepting chemotaxis protein
MTLAFAPGGELCRIVAVNEQIKTIVAMAFKINLMAMNAIFLAKRAGHAALGFSVLSNELRRFASDLQQQMELLRQLTYSSVATVTSLVKLERMTRVIDQLRLEANGRAHDLVEHYVRTHPSLLIDSKRESLSAQYRQLIQTISTTSQLVELGSVLARSAKIEAAYGGIFSSALTQVSSDFEHIISEIQHSLGLLSRYQTS